MNESDRWEESMLDLFDWIIDFVTGRDDVTTDDIRLAIARGGGSLTGRDRAEAAYRLMKELMLDATAGQRPAR